jgi:hypothetical protein
VSGRIRRISGILWSVRGVFSDGTVVHPLIEHE